jgi:tRNA pseudouridine32 synthase/23S rRNA pseudouridine746 synthase
MSPPTYWYEGRCPKTGEWLRLPRTAEVEAIAQTLMQHLATDDQYCQEGKMYGVLLVETPTGEHHILQAFSGLLNGNSIASGWVPPIPGRDRVALVEAHTLTLLETIKQELIRLQQLPERQHHATLAQEFATHLQHLTCQQQQRKQERQQQRQQLLKTLSGEALTNALKQLDDQSRQDGIQRRRLKHQWNEILQPLNHQIQQANTRIAALKQQRKTLSRQLQAEMHAAYSLANFAGESLSLNQLMPDGLPTGTGDCCAPKLLHHAATHHLKPLAMAEFWWGPNSPNGDKVQGQFYGACTDRCQPLLGFLLSGQSFTPPPLTPASPLPIQYQDHWLVVVDKPAGLLSVPGRYRDRQDSVLSRLQHLLPDGKKLLIVHRLDQDTSGLLLFARDPQTQKHLRRQFETHQVRKIYEAILSGTGTPTAGTIDLPLWGNPSDRPRQTVHQQHGKPSLTHFRQIATDATQTRMEFMPITGRTHQIRVHAAHPDGLGIPILGDRLYGCNTTAQRLHLHARELQIQHPHSGQPLHLQTAPFF